MPHPLQNLQRLLAGAGTPSRGTILEILPTGIRVSTASGILIVTRLMGDATTYRPGDTVRLQNGVVLGRSGGGETYVV